MVPVQPNIISLGEIFFGLSSSDFCLLDNNFAASSAISLKELKPLEPVKQFALRALTISALILLLLIDKFHFIFSEITFDLVYTDAYSAPFLK